MPATAPLTHDSAQSELKLRCLQLAGSDLFLAKQLYAWVSGEDAKTPRQLINEALEAANVR